MCLKGRCQNNSDYLNICTMCLLMTSSFACNAFCLNILFLQTNSIAFVFSFCSLGVFGTFKLTKRNDTVQQHAGICAFSQSVCVLLFKIEKLLSDMVVYILCSVWMRWQIISRDTHAHISLYSSSTCNAR